jgi:EmrB/QacA subfamily drug resistance transporter
VTDAVAKYATTARVAPGDGPDGAEDGSFVAYGTPKGRWIIVTMVLGSAMVFLDSTVVNVALPAIGRTFHTGLEGLQWTISAYLLTLGSLLLLGGALGDAYGRRRVFVIGVFVFTVASILCGVAPTPGFLIAARAAQGVGGALLVPESLAIISAVFRPQDRGSAIGAWSGLSAVATAGGPFLGGYLVDAASWRWVFLINVPIAAATVWMAVRHVPESRDPSASRRLDVRGAAIITLGLAGVVYALIEGPGKGLGDPAVLVAGVLGVLLLAAFPFVERRLREPMVPLEIFRSRQFTGANMTTLFVYGALGGATFFLAIELQTVLGYSALAAGAAFWPIPLLLFVLSARVGRLAQRIGPRLPMTAGPALAGVGFVLLSGIGPGTRYVSGVLPGVVVFALGLSFTVAPLSTAVLGSVEDRHKGLASGINNAVSRIAGLVAVALLPVAAGIASANVTGGASFDAGFGRAMWISAGLCWVGALVSFISVSGAERRRRLRSVPHPGLQHACCDPALEEVRSAPAASAPMTARSDRAGE